MERPAKINEALEHLLLALWDAAGERGVEKFGLVVHRSAMHLIQDAYSPQRVRRIDAGKYEVETAMGVVNLYDNSWNW